MTWLEIIDSAIKIGLGAFLGGIFAYLLNKQTHVHEINKEILLENRQTLKDASAKFKNIHANVIALTQEIAHDYNLYIREYEKYAEKRKSNENNVKFKMPKKPDFYERRSDITTKLLLELYSLQGVLMLYGYNKMSSVIYEYTSNVTVISPKEDDEEDIPDIEGMKKFTNLRNDFYEAAHYYLSSQNLR